MKNVAYVRVSSKSQNENRQLDELIQSGLEISKIFIDKQSGADFDRPAYKKMVRCLKPKDVIVIKSIDRLGRNYQEIMEQWRFLTKELKVQIHVIDMPILNRGENQDLIQHFISDLVLQLLSFVAENERENIKSRQAEGIRSAKSRGVKFGRPRLKDPKNLAEDILLWKEGKISFKELKKKSGMSEATLYRRIKKIKHI
ncbi:recombinase family protein [Anaerorhabdus sp.]|uniref:recombinase family protein n=2 Tax=Anaerorhabdus sp. TaxID=1872524 RepID=UPI002B21F9C3|nr:recombinase family protein [Anaerorhabdus sp.]MEA4875592.1 recombinase family protein [Anaerorhabdus sp.]